MRHPKLTAALFLFATLLTGCGKPTYTVPADFTPYVSRFESAAKDQGHDIVVNDLVVQFGDPGTGANGLPNKGLCEIGAGTPTITINQKAWDDGDDSAKEATIFHELGHCILHRVHKTDEELDPNSGEERPVSMMYPVALGSVYQEYHDSYITELFADE